MDVSLPTDLHAYVRKKVESGHFPSEGSVIEAALVRYREQEDGAGPIPDDLIDHEFVAYCSREADDGATVETVLDATSKIGGSMARAIIEDERADRS